MDREDQEHFKTIAAASQELPLGSSKEASSSLLDPAYCLERAKQIFGCYRRDEAHDPDRYAAALAAVMSEYPKLVVDYACDPRTGVITKFPNGLPQVGQIKEYLEATLAHIQNMERLKRSPPTRPVTFEKPAPVSNLFVPNDNPLYERMLALHEEMKGQNSYAEQRVCFDGVKRWGLWVPLSWWENNQMAAWKRLGAQ